MTITCQAKPCEIDAPHYSIFCEEHTFWAKFVESQVREQIATEIEALRDGIKSKNDFVEKHAPVDAYEIVWRAADIARGQK